MQLQPQILEHGLSNFTKFGLSIFVRHIHKSFYDHKVRKWRVKEKSRAIQSITVVACNKNLPGCLITAFIGNFLVSGETIHEQLLLGSVEWMNEFLQFLHILH